jgi:hypothetical protein
VLLVEDEPDDLGVEPAAAEAVEEVETVDVEVETVDV